MTRRFLVRALILASLICLSFSADAADAIATRDAAIKVALDELIIAPAPDTLRQYNSIQVTDDFRVQGDSGIDLSKTLGLSAFVCVRQSDRMPKDSAKAQQAFQKFLDYFDATATANITIKQKGERLELIKAAIAAGSWRAKYADLMWEIKENHLDQRKSYAFAVKLIDMANHGIPAAIRGVDSWISYNTSTERLQIQKAGVQSGNPQIIGNVGHRLAFNTLKYRARGLNMLKCAIRQGDVTSYYSVGLVAQREGRWVDAYRIWERGANLGCERCIEKLEDIATLDPKFSFGRDTTVNAVPALKKLNDFYNNQFFWKLTELPELRQQAPDDLLFKLSEKQIVALVENFMVISGMKTRPMIEMARAKHLDSKTGQVLGSK